jgi:hypothetical protein
MATDACRGAVSTARPGLHELNLLDTPDLELMCLWAFNDSATDALRGVEAGSGVPPVPVADFAATLKGPVPNKAVAAKARRHTISSSDSA